MDEVNNLIRLLLENIKCKDLYCFGYKLGKDFNFNYGTAPKLSPFQETLLKSYFEAYTLEELDVYSSLSFDELKERILNSYFKID